MEKSIAISDMAFSRTGQGVPKTTLVTPQVHCSIASSGTPKDNNQCRTDESNLAAGAVARPARGNIRYRYIIMPWYARTNS